MVHWDRSFLMGCAAVHGGKGIGPVVKHPPIRHVARRCGPFGWPRSRRAPKAVGVHPVRLLGEERNPFAHEGNLMLGSDGAFGR